MKHKHIVVLLLALSVLVVFLLFAVGQRKRIIASIRNEILSTIEAQGGVFQLHGEIDRAFDKLSELNGTTSTRIRIEEKDYPDYPILINLGRSVQVFPATDERPRYIMILRGGHYSTHVVSMFDPNIVDDALSAWSEGALLLITNGVYLTR